jgi:hypothetical protein
MRKTNNLKNHQLLVCASSQQQVVQFQWKSECNYNGKRFHSIDKRMTVCLFCISDFGLIKILCCLTLIWIVHLNSQVVSTTSHKICSVVGGVNLVIPFFPTLFPSSSCSYFPLRYMTTVAKVVKQPWFNVDHLLIRASSTIIPSLIGKPLVAKFSRLGILCNRAIIHECRRHR